MSTEKIWKLTYQLPQAFYIIVNSKDALLSKEIAGLDLAMREDITQVFKKAVEIKGRKIHAIRE